MDSISFILASALEQIRKTLHDLPRVSGTSLGLDERIGLVWVDYDNDLIITEQRGPLDYYGGFEYINDDAITTLGPFTIYDATHENGSRISHALDYYHKVSH